MGGLAVSTLKALSGCTLLGTWGQDDRILQLVCRQAIAAEIHCNKLEGDCEDVMSQLMPGGGGDRGLGDWHGGLPQGLKTRQQRRRGGKINGREGEILALVDLPTRACVMLCLQPRETVPIRYKIYKLLILKHWIMEPGFPDINLS